MVAELRPRQPASAGWVCDIADRGWVSSTFDGIGNRYGRVDLLVNCAGRSMLRPFLEMSDEDLDWVMGPNLLGVVHCIRAADPWLADGGRIVNIASVSGRVPTPGEAFYSAMKAAVVSLGESIEAELASRRIGITTVLPGEMSTALFDAHDSWELRPDFQRNLEVPPERVARAIVRGIRRGRAQVVAPASMRAVLLLQRLAPRLFQIGVNRFYRRVFEPRLVGKPGRE